MLTKIENEKIHDFQRVLYLLDGLWLKAAGAEFGAGLGFESLVEDCSALFDSSVVAGAPSSCLRKSLGGVVPAVVSFCSCKAAIGGASFDGISVDEVLENVGGCVIGG